MVQAGLGTDARFGYMPGTDSLHACGAARLEQCSRIGDTADCSEGALCV